MRIRPRRVLIDKPSEVLRLRQDVAHAFAVPDEDEVLLRDREDSLEQFRLAPQLLHTVLKCTERFLTKAILERFRPAAQLFQTALNRTELL